MDNILKNIDKVNKIDFLNKLASGKYELIEPYKPQPQLTFNLQPDGLYLCKEDGRILSAEEILNLPGYRMNLQLVADRLQVEGKKSPSGFVMIPWSEQEYLDSLLRSKYDIVITYNESDPKKPFKSETESYSFNDLLRINKENPDIKFLLDEEARNKYVQELEKQC